MESVISAFWVGVNTKKTIGIWILDEDFFKDLPEYHNKFVIKEDKTNNCEYFKSTTKISS